ncbi:MAG TPA: NAD+ synthase [Edaphocola sp.]|nr:NAD+ synthase [Edaphocola sp.]
MKIFLAQQNYIIGDFEHNSQKIIEAIRRAKKNGGDLIVFSELAICGYPPKDFLEFDDFIQSCIDCIDQIKREAVGIAVLVGAPARNSVPEGKDLYNSAYFLEGGEIKQVVRKSLLPTYDIFDEYRYFEPASEWQCVIFKGKKLAVTICEDIWDLVADPLYKVPPMDHLVREQPDIMINLSASPFSYTHASSRMAMARKNVSRYQLPMIYCNTVGAQTEIIFDGGSFALDAHGQQLLQMPFFGEALTAIEWAKNGELQPLTSQDDLPEYPKDIDEEKLHPDLNIDKIHDALVLGIREYFSKMGFEKAIVASSGGIDSAVVLSMACEALGAVNVQALLLPSGFSSDHSIADARALSEALGNPYDIIPIQPAFDSVRESLRPAFKDLPFGLAEENIQARLRGLFAMAYSNKFGSILLNTSNKSELSVGYGTLYGDMAGGLSVIGDVYKTQVYALARYINRNREIIPTNILAKAPSAELRPGQKDADSLPDYALMDDLLYRYIECRHRKKTLMAAGFPEDLIQKVLSMVNRNEYKRNQFCPILRVSPKAFGIGRRMPVVARYEG